MQELHPFDIVTSLYIDFCTGGFKQKSHGVLQPGLFLVLSVSSDSTVVALKITSNNTSGTSNRFNINILQHPFLQCNSSIQCDKPNTLLQKHCRKIGSLYYPLRRDFLLFFTPVLGRLRLSLEEYSTNYISPNKKEN